MITGLLSLLLSLTAAPPAAGQTDALVLQLNIIEGEGAVHVAGSRSRVPLTVQVTDEVGRPVDKAAVSFLLPHDGPSGIFASGLSTEVLTTGRDGKASVRGIRWGNTAGAVRIRITAMKGDARAGRVSAQYLEALHSATAPGSQPVSHSVSKPKTKWIAIAVLAAGAAVGGIVLGASSGSSSNNPGVVPAAVTEPPNVQVGLPAITIGAP
jgi:hypothetical protein